MKEKLSRNAQTRHFSTDPATVGYRTSPIKGDLGIDFSHGAAAFGECHEVAQQLFARCSSAAIWRMSSLADWHSEKPTDAKLAKAPIDLT
jgi:hypothetical protein